MEQKLQAAIEAILFAMGGSVELKNLHRRSDMTKKRQKIIRQMMDRYEKEDRGIRIIELEASFQMCTKKEMYEYLIRVAKQPKNRFLRMYFGNAFDHRLQAAGYKTGNRKIRGVKSDHAVSKLVEYDLVEKWGVWMRRENRFYLEPQKSFCADSVYIL